MNWFTEKQTTDETAFYVSEFVAAQTRVTQIIDLQLTLRYSGVPIRTVRYMFEITSL